MADWFSTLTTKDSETLLLGTSPGKAVLSTADRAARNLLEAKESLIKLCLEELKAGSLAPLIQAVLDGKVEVDFRTPEGLSAVHLAVLRGDVKAVQQLLDVASCPVDFKSLKGRTPLMHAVMKGHLQLIKVFLDRGADIEAKDENSMTPILVAAQHGKSTAYLVLRHRGADVAAVDINGCSAAHWAAFHNHSGFLHMLRAFNPSFEAKDLQGWTPLHRASFSNSTRSLEYLLRSGCDAEAKDSEGRNALEVAQENRLAAAQGVFKSYSFKGDNWAGSFKYVYLSCWLALYLDYIVAVLPHTAHYFWASLAFNLCMLILPVCCVFTLCSQPGELARQADSPEVGVIPSIGEAFEAGDFESIPDGNLICFTCMLKRPQRSKHCRFCGHCIPRQDHHCLLIGKCIGEHNLKHFVLSLALTYFSVLLFLYLELQLFSAHVTDPDTSSFVVQTVLRVLELADLNVGMALACVPVAWYAGWYMFMEVASISQGLTANEAFNRHRYKYLYSQGSTKVMHFTNPFTKGLIINWADFLGS